MKISIIIPCYNAEPYVAQTIGSVLDQTHPPYEVIVVDDGSTDGSLRVAQRFEARFPERVRVLSQRSGRASRTRNIGAAVATGDALMFLDADDVIAPDTLQALTDALARNSDGVAMCPWFRLVYHDGRWVKRPPSCAARPSGQDPLASWLTGWYHPPCSVLWSWNAFKTAGRWDERWNPNDDGDLMMRALALGAPLVEAPSGAGFYRRLPGAGATLSGARLTPRGLRARLRTVKKIADLLERQGKLRPYRAAISKSFELIACDSCNRAPDVYKQAEAYTRQYAPVKWIATVQRGLHAVARKGRSAGRILCRSNRTQDAGVEGTWAGGTALEQPEEIRYGLELAEETLQLQPARAADVPKASQAAAAPAVSVIIPTFNRAHVLRRTIDSVLVQTFRDFELLVVDDGSTDGTEALVKEYEDARVRYLSQPKNGGVGAARNRGLREARGEYVAFLDSDDEWLPEKLALQVELMRNSADDVGLVYTGVETVFGDGTRKIAVASARGDLYRSLLLRNLIHGGGSNVMIRRSVITDVGYFDEHLSAIEDYDYWVRISRHYQVECVSAPLIRYYNWQAAVDREIANTRRSLNRRANEQAREAFYRRYRREMMRAGVAPQFLVESAWRILAEAEGNRWTARRLAMRAWLLAPRSREPYWVLSHTIPALAVGTALRRGYRRCLRRSES